MRVVIEPQSEGEPGRRKLWLGPNQQVRVGRTEWAEFSVADPELADIHFVLETDNVRCTVRNSEAANGIFVNGVAVREAVLKHGDDLLAGSTHFRVAVDDTLPVAKKRSASRLPQIASAPAKSVGRSSALRIVAVDPGVTRTAAVPCSPVAGITLPETVRVGGAQRKYSGTLCPSGMARFQEVRLKPGELVQRLGRHAAPFLVINATRLEKELLDQFAGAINLVSPERSNAGSPLLVLFLPIKTADQLRIVESLWGGDQLIVGFSRQPLSQVASGLSLQLSFFLAPSVLRSHLDHSERRVVSKLIGLFDAAMVETEDGDDWLVYTHPEGPSPWVSAGFPGVG